MRSSAPHRLVRHRALGVVLDAEFVISKRPVRSPHLYRRRRITSRHAANATRSTKPVNDLAILDVEWRTMTISAELFEVTADGSILAPDGRVIVFSVERFENDICRGTCCFICGADRSSKEFNDEHVLPRWLLRRHNLFACEITLPNRTSFRYDQYKISCCAECNTYMGRHIEEPVRTLLTSGYDAVADHLKTYGPELLFRWLSLIYIKTHLRDAAFPWTRDRRKDVGPISSVYDWNALHHIHAVARSLLVGVECGYGVIGSFAALPALNVLSDGDFDYGDMYLAHSILIRTGGTALVAVLNDSCAALNEYKSKLAKITAPLTAPQLREVLSEFGYCNLHLTTRPKFATISVPGGFQIAAEIPQYLKFDWEQPPTLGDVMSYICGPFLSGIPEEQRETIATGLREGRWSWMFDGEGNFIDNTRFAINP